MSGRVRGVAVLAVGLLVVAACQSSATPSPSTSPSAAQPSSVAPSLAPSPVASPSTVPSPSTSAAARWTAAGSPIAWRRDPHAVALSGGRVLVVGAVEPDDGSALQTTAEIYDQATSTWTATEGLPKGRTEFIAVPIGDDRVLVAGGLNADEKQQSYSSAYIYDGAPGKGTWTKTGLMGVARTAPSAAVLPDGRVLVAGGYFYSPPSSSLDDDGSTGAAGARLLDVDPGVGGAAMATAELFDPATGTWSPTGSMRYARTGAGAVSLSDGRVLVVGSGASSGAGYSVIVDGHAFDTAEIYDPATGRFSLAGTLPPIDRAALEKAGKKGANPIPEDDGEIGGGTVAALQDGGAVWIGVTNYWKHAADMTRSFRYDPATHKWSEIGQTYVFVGEPTPVPLWTPDVPALVGARVASLHDGRVLVAGGAGPNQYGDKGYNATPTTAAAELYDPASNAWSAAPAMPEPRSGGATVVLPDGSVLLVNGTNDTGSDITNVSTAVRFVP